MSPEEFLLRIGPRSIDRRKCQIGRDLAGDVGIQRMLPKAGEVGREVLVLRSPRPRKLGANKITMKRSGDGGGFNWAAVDRPRKLLASHRALPARLCTWSRFNWAAVDRPLVARMADLALTSATCAEGFNCGPRSI